MAKEGSAPKMKSLKVLDGLVAELHSLVLKLESLTNTVYLTIEKVHSLESDESDLKRKVEECKLMLQNIQKYGGAFVDSVQTFLGSAKLNQEQEIYLKDAVKRGKTGSLKCYIDQTKSRLKQCQERHKELLEKYKEARIMYEKNVRKCETRKLEAKNKNITTKVICGGCSITLIAIVAAIAAIGVGTSVIVATGTIVFCIVVLAWLLITQYNKSEKTFKGLYNDMDELVTKMNNLRPNMVAIERRLTLISGDLDIVGHAGHERNSSEQAGNKKNCPNKKDCPKPKYWPLGTLWNGVKHYVLKVVGKLPHRSTPNNVTNVKEEKSTFEYDRFCQILDTLLDGIRKCDHELQITVARWSTAINVQDM